MRARVGLVVSAIGAKSFICPGRDSSLSPHLQIIYVPLAFRLGLWWPAPPAAPRIAWPPPGLERAERGSQQSAGGGEAQAKPQAAPPSFAAWKKEEARRRTREQATETSWVRHRGAAMYSGLAIRKASIAALPTASQPAQQPLPCLCKATSIDLTT